MERDKLQTELKTCVYGILFLKGIHLGIFWVIVQEILLTLQQKLMKEPGSYNLQWKPESFNLVFISKVMERGKLQTELENIFPFSKRSISEFSGQFNNEHELSLNCLTLQGGWLFDLQ